jgi:hypothetical protein
VTEPFYPDVGAGFKRMLFYFGDWGYLGAGAEVQKAVILCMKWLVIVFSLCGGFQAM